MLQTYNEFIAAYKAGYRDRQAERDYDPVKAMLDKGILIGIQKSVPVFMDNAYADIGKIIGIADIRVLSDDIEIDMFIKTGPFRAFITAGDLKALSLGGIFTNIKDGSRLMEIVEAWTRPDKTPEDNLENI